MRFHIKNMACGGCLRGVTKAIQSLDPQAEVSADVEARVIDVDSRESAAGIVAALHAAGFPASIEPASQELPR